MQRSELHKFHLPDSPGVYLFTQGKGRAKKILYIGKATSLRDRVRSYFDDDLIATRGPGIVDMVTKSDAISYEATPTVLEALVREAALIQQHMPPANVEGKDGKTFLYVIITDEYIPRVLTVRGKDVDFKEKKYGTLKFKSSYGPFPSGNQLKEALRLIRRIFPFFDTKNPIQEKESKHAKAKMEFNRQIGLYPHEIDRPVYLKSIRNVGLFLGGNVTTLRATLEKEMKQAAKLEKFETAAQIRNQLYAIDHVQDVSLIKKEDETVDQGLRIEAYDTAHLSGTNAIGVMTVVLGNTPYRSLYRTFNIKGVGGKTLNDDIASLKEILSRRFGHPEWGYPRVIVIDGGKTHKKTAEKILADLGITIPVVAVVKNDKHQPREILGAAGSGITTAQAVLANSEAHRFAVGKHRAKRRIVRK